MDVLFVETSVFERFVSELLAEEEYRALQELLIERPDAGDVMHGTGGIRKLRWGAGGKGKRGGVRVIYYWRTARNRIYLLTIYGKGTRDDLTPTERAVLKKVVEAIENE